MAFKKTPPIVPGMPSKSNTEAQEGLAASSAVQDKPNLTKHAGGRPSSYKDTYPKQAEKLCLLGATDPEIADFFEVSLSTIANWKVSHQEFLHALKSGKSLSDERVERSLYHKAIGYTFEAVKIMAVAGDVRVVPYTEHIPPDTTACIFWLKNRRQQQWRDVHKHEHGQPGEFDGLEPNELRERLRREAEEIGEGTIAAALTRGNGDVRGKPN